MPKNPFGDEPDRTGRPVNPFGDEESESAPGADADPADTIAYAASRIRRLRSLVGAEGLTLSATRELIDHLTTALDAAARALRERR